MSAMQTGLFLTHPSQIAVSMSESGDRVNAAVSLEEIFRGEKALGTVEHFCELFLTSV